jgi:calcium permeable stress-gated cation channel
MITRESIFYINLRQAYLMSPLYAKRISSRTVLFTSVPKEYLNEAKLRSMLGEHVVRIWIPTNTKDLDDIVGERDKTAMKLEAAETKLIKLANAARLKAIKKGTIRAEDTTGITGDGAESGSIAGRWISQKQRPTHRLKPIIGRKVDTISWARAELPRLINETETEQRKHRAREVDILSSVFVEFDSLPEAQAAYQSLTHHQALHMAPRYTGMTPGEIIWSNLRIAWWERVMRFTATTAATVAVIIFWSIPVAIVASFSNINYLIDSFTWLEFLRKIPPVIFGVVSGLLPVVLLVVLMILLPIFLRCKGFPVLIQSRGS